MSGPTRYEINGERHYATDVEGKAYPSVTTILGKTASEKSKNMLRNWNVKNPGGLEAAAARGSAVHKACEDYIRGIPVEIDERYLPFWEGLSQHLDRYDHFIWSEKPLDPKWKYTTGSDGISRVWSHKYQFCGCPDFIGVRNGVMILGDFKTSNQPYCRYFPDKDNRQNFTGWSKFTKCSMQLGAYSLAIKETLDLDIDAAQIVVSTPKTNQSFILRGDELQRFQQKWLQKVRRYWEMKEEERLAKKILKDARDDLASSQVSSDESNKTDHCPATVS